MRRRRELLQTARLYLTTVVFQVQRVKSNSRKRDAIDAAVVMVMAAVLF